ncbi:MAG: phage terminase small subunit P27 family [Caldimonas sp.]
MSRPVSIAVKTLRGTARQDRQKAKLDPAARLVDVPPAPRHLSAAAAAEWDRLAADLVALGTLTAADLRALELLVQTLDSCQTFAAAIERDGLLIESGGGAMKAHPGLAGLGTARAQARALLRDFGLMPSARVDAAPGAPPGPDPLDEFTIAGR